MKKIVLLYTHLLFIIFAQTASAQNIGNNFPIVSKEQAASIVVDNQDHAVVQKAVLLLQSDIEKISGKKAELTNKTSLSKNIIIVGSLDKSSLIQKLVEEKKLS